MPLAFEVPDQVEQAVALGGRQAGGGLVEGDDATAARQRACDLHDLAFGHAEATHGAVTGKSGGSGTADVAPLARCDCLRVEQYRRAPVWPRKMFCATSSWGTRLGSWLTSPMPRASACRGSAIVTALAWPSITIVAGVGLLDAEQDLHQRRLAGSVLAEQRVDLAGPNDRSRRP